MKLYKGKYLIGIYAPVEEGETLLALCENIKIFAKLLNIKLGNAQEILRLLFIKKRHFLRFNGKICSVEFINQMDNTNLD